jgi:hypothetical protein
VRIAQSRTRLTLGAMALAGAVFAVEIARTTEGARIEVGAESREVNATGVEAPAPVEMPDLAAAPMRVRDPRPMQGIEADASTPAQTAEAPPVAPPCPADIQFVDAVTGRAIDGCVAADASTQERWSLIGVRAPVWEWVTGDASEAEPRWRATCVTRVFRPPSPYFLWRESDVAACSDRAKAFRVVQPLHRELDVRLRVLLPDGSRAPWGLLTSVAVDGASEAASVEGIGRGMIRVRRVPWLPERSFTLQFRATAAGTRVEESECVRTYEPEQIDDDDGHLEMISESVESKSFDLTVPMPTSASDPVELDVVLDWNIVSSDQIACYFGSSCHRCCGCGRSVREVPRGDARVRLVDAAGRPMAGVRVRIASIPAVTDADGVARVTGAREGAGVVVVEGAGYRFGRVPITIVAGQEASLDLTEAPVSTLELHVVDVDGRPVPSASVELRPSAFDWFDVDADGIQRLDPFTDAYGVRLARGVPCGAVRVTARFAGRSGKGETFVRAGVPSVVTVVVE